MRILTEQESFAALEQQISYAYQPVVSLPDSRVRYVEGLVRWRRGRRTLSPQQLLQQLTTDDLVDRFTQLGLSHLLRDLSRLKRLFGSDTSVALNMSLAQLVRGIETVSLVASAINEFDVSPADLRIEMVEDVHVSNLETIREPLRQLRSMGVKVMLDDFGTGASSLAALTDIPYDGIKIDRRFVAAMFSHPPARSVIEAVINFGESTDIEVVAEGVEDAITMNELDRLGCQLVQGYLFGEPIPIDALGPSSKARRSLPGVGTSSAVTPTDAQRQELARQVEGIEPRRLHRQSADLRGMYQAVRAELDQFSPSSIAEVELELLRQMTIAAVYSGESSLALEWGLQASQLADRLNKPDTNVEVLALVAATPSTSQSSRFVGVEALARCLQIRATGDLSDEALSTLDNILGAALGYLGMPDRAASWWNDAIIRSTDSDHPGDFFAAVNLLDHELGRFEDKHPDFDEAAQSVSRQRIVRAVAKLEASSHVFDGIVESFRARYAVANNDIAAAKGHLEGCTTGPTSSVVQAHCVSRARAIIAREAGEYEEFHRFCEELAAATGPIPMLRHHRFQARRLAVDALVRLGRFEEALAAQDRLLDDQLTMVNERSSGLFDWLQIRVDFDLQFAHLLSFLGFQHGSEPDQSDLVRAEPR